MYSSLLDLARELNTLNDDNLADRGITNSDVQWCLSELQDMLEAEQPTLTPSNEAEKAIQRMGEFGKRFLDYKGCSRGPMGAPGECTIEEWVHAMPVLKDVDGEKWRPVQEAALNALLNSLPPNEPLTLDELREMDGEPVWVELYQAWALVEVKQNKSVMFYGNSFSCSYSRTWQVYRFQPYRFPPEDRNGR